MSDQEEKKIVDATEEGTTDEVEKVKKDKKDKKEKKDKKDKKEKKDKKKKAKDNEDDEEEEQAQIDTSTAVEDKKEDKAEAEEEEDEVDLINFDDMKKKKKKKSKESKTEQAAGGEEKEKKKKSKKDKADDDQDDGIEEKFDLHNVPGHEVYTYAFMLERIEKELKKRNAQMDDANSKFQQEVPTIKRTATKTQWMNFDSISKTMNRTPDHVLSFYTTELGSEGNFNSENQMILVGKYQQKHILSLLKKYIAQYVQCLNCKGQNTQLEKDQSTRLYELKCQDCNAHRTVQSIKAGFHATKRGERKKARQ